ncbi:MAG: hypothetical protein M0039_03855 [Pseudomonadota bacterium]|nr:hypothetical protein [Pseudomonadota bacterium]
MVTKVCFWATALLTPIVLSACGGGGTPSSAPTTTHSVSISWNAAHQSGVNGPGGGYQVLVNGQVAATVPYVSGTLTPTSAQLVMKTGLYSVAVRAYATLDAQGGSSGSYSAPSQPLLVLVP